jgi:hypothetical protein
LILFIGLIITFNDLVQIFKSDYFALTKLPVIFFDHKIFFVHILPFMISFAFLSCNNFDKETKVIYPTPPDITPTFEVKY